MALQSKIFSWGSYAYGSESNAYVLELTLTENSTSQADNTSSITYSLVLKSGNQNRFQGDVTSKLKFNGTLVASKTENKYLDFNSSWTLLSGTTSVKHSDDGSLTMPIEVSIDTTDSNQYAPPDKTLNWSWPLTQITRYTKCTAPTSFVMTPDTSMGVFIEKLTLTWSGAKGGTNNAITGYALQARKRTASGTWSAWADSTITKSGSVAKPTNVEWGGAVQYRVRTKGAAGSSYYSDWKESNVVDKLHTSICVKNAPCVAYIKSGDSMEVFVPCIYRNGAWQVNGS